MKVKTALSVCSKLMKSKSKESPEGGYNTPEGRLTYQEIANELDKLVEFIYPELDTRPIQKVVCCRDCGNYRKFKKKGEGWGSKKVEWLCRIDKCKRRPDFFCSDSIERK